MSWFHPEEEQQVGQLIHYDRAHPGTHYLIEYPDGEAYVCVYFTDYESENTGDLDIDVDDPLYDEFYQVAMMITNLARPGRRGYTESLAVDYRDFPASITDVDTGAVVYPAPVAP